jgi:hypothetical protein
VLAVLVRRYSDRRLHLWEGPQVTATAILSDSDGLSYDERAMTILDMYKDVEEDIDSRLTLPRVPLYYDRKAQPITLGRWVVLNELGDPEYGPTGMHYKVLGRTRVGPYVVSTVWLGIDHGFGRAAPIIFESMVFSAEPVIEHEGGMHRQDFDMDRYATEEQAYAGHEQMVTVVRSTLLFDAEVVQEWPE